MPEMVVRLKISLLMLKIHGSFHLFLLIIIVIIMVKIIIIDIGSSSSMSSNSRASLERENLILLTFYRAFWKYSTSLSKTMKKGPLLILQPKKEK